MDTVKNTDSLNAQARRTPLNLAQVFHELVQIQTGTLSIYEEKLLPKKPSLI